MLTRAEQWAIVARLVEMMRADGSWAGETHVQKTIFFLKRLLNVPTRYDFVLYMHGPYSFDLHDDLGAMRANSILALKPQAHYGASFELGQFGERAINRSKETVEQYEEQLRFMSKHIGGENIRTLERYSTALYVKFLNPDADDTSVQDEIMRLKPHIQAGPALEAAKVVNDIRKAASDADLIRS